MLFRSVVTQAKRLMSTYEERFIRLFFEQLFDIGRYATESADSVKSDFYKEGYLVFRDLFKSDANLSQFIRPGFTYLNTRLASHYGMSGGNGGNANEFVRVDTADRGGVLQQGAFLASTSLPDATHPIKRGKWVQGRLLCKEIAPTPPELLAKIGEVQRSIPMDTPIHKRFELHRQAGTSCFNCHRYMDPLGLGLESYDQLGRVRTLYENNPSKPIVDGGDVDGKSFKGPKAMNDLITELPDFSRCMGERLTVYMLGKLPVAADIPYHESLSRKVNGKLPSFREMVLRTIGSKGFREVMFTGGSS